MNDDRYYLRLLINVFCHMPVGQLRKVLCHLFILTYDL
jgi:hypothetical protein